METKELTKEAKISKIYEAMADKAIWFWTIICQDGERYVNLWHEEECVGWDEDGSPDNYIERVNVIPLEDREMGVCHIRLFYEKKENISISMIKYDKIQKVVGNPVLRWDLEKYVDANCFWIEKEEWKERDLEALKEYWSIMHYWLIWYHNEPVDKRPSEMIDYVLSLIVDND